MGAPPLVVIGWDGATWDLLAAWVREGKLPQLARLMESGSFGSLQSTPLPLSPAAWSTIVTGQNPGRHGVYDWFERRPNSYEVDYVHTSRIAAKAIWHYFNEGGNSIGVFCPPMLYPAVPLNGFMVSGMAAPSPQAVDFAYPSDLLAEIEAHVGPYQAAETEVFKYGREAEYLQSVLDWLDYQKRAVHYLIEHHPCDAYLLVFMQSDHAQHKLWRYQDPDFPGYNPNYDSLYREAMLRVYQTLDDALGELLVYFGEDANYVLLSDHGAGPSYGAMYINHWLQKEGLLSLRGGPGAQVKHWLARSQLVLRAYRLLARLGLGRVAQRVSKPVRNKALNAFLSFEDIDWSRTKAYSRGAFGQIFVNLKGREPQGIVEPGRPYQELVDGIVAKLQALKHPETGDRLISDIHRREEVFQGPFLERSADVLFSIQHYLYQSSVRLGLESKAILGLSDYDDSGGHRPEGILVTAGRGILKGAVLRGATLADILPTLLALAGLSVPIDLDGRVLREVLTETQWMRVQSAVAAEEPVEAQRDTQSLEVTPELAEEELALLEERLRNLGYLG